MVTGPILYTVYLFSCQCGQVPLADAAHGSAVSLEATLRRHPLSGGTTPDGRSGHAHAVRRVVTPNPIPARLPHVHAALQVLADSSAGRSEAKVI